MTAPAPDLCPLCGADLTGEPQPPTHYGVVMHFSRRIDLYKPNTEQIVAYRCPDCNGTWPVEGTQ